MNSITMDRHIGLARRWSRLAGGSALLLLAACGSDPVRPQDGVPTRLSLAVASRELASFGDSAIVRPQVYDQHGLAMTGVVMDWSLSVPGVLEPLGNGSFRAIGNGDVTIRASIPLGPTGVRPSGYWAEGVSATVNVRVQQRAARLQIDPVDTAFTTINAVRRLRVSVTDARGNLMQTLQEPVQFRSADQDVVTIDPTGAVRSRKLGVTRVSAQFEGLSAERTFTVDPRLAHTACMVYARRRRASQDCVTNGFTVHARAEQP